MAVEDVVRAVGEAITKLPTTQLEQANQALQEAHGTLARVTEGTFDPEAQQAIATFGSGIEDVGRVQQLVARARQALDGYLGKLGDVETSPPSGSRRGQAAATAGSPQPSKLDADKVEELRSELPPPVPKPNPESKKTHGRWVDAQGTVQPIVSGEDEHSEAAAEMFKQAGVPPSKKLAITAHAEVKVVVQMVQANQAHSEVVVNNRPCPGPLGCDALLPVILPDGSSLTVHGPNYRKTYTGGKKW